MHVQTHILSGWCLGNLVPLTVRERLLCMLTASLPDVDGLGIVISQEVYWKYHHYLGHCAVFGLVLSLSFAAFSKRKAMAFFIYLALFHLHLILDVAGSGTSWQIHYLWPFNSTGFKVD